MKEIEKGSVVKWKVSEPFVNERNRLGDEGYYRVTAKFAKTANIGGIFNGVIYFKSVPLVELTEAHDEWYEGWTQSETYKCM